MLCILLVISTWLSASIQSSEIYAQLREERNIGWTAGLNERFNGMTFGDAKVISGSAHKLRPDTIPLAAPPNINISIPMSYNFTERFPECDFGPLDQGVCGSCWAFSVAKSFSHRYCRKHREKIVFSPGNLVGCDRRNNACMGGTAITAWRYIDLRGLPLESCQPYNMNATSFKCSKTCANLSMKFETKYSEFWSVARYASIPEIQIGIMTEGPVSTSFRAYSDLIFYKSGVYSHAKGDLLAYHAVEIVGWGVHNGVDYWLVSNSWGANWGLQGLFMIRRGVNECGIEDYISAGRPK